MERQWKGQTKVSSQFWAKDIVVPSGHINLIGAKFALSYYVVDLIADTDTVATDCS